MNARIVTVGCLLALLLTGCSVTPPGQSENALSNIVVVTPAIPEQRYQLEVAKLSDVLNQQADELEDEVLGQLYYRRGTLYDALGLTTLARIDFNYALEYQPRLADAYNYLGIHFTQFGQYEHAYEALDSVLELEPEHPYALLNRGIAAYYDQRFDLAVEDLQTYYAEDPTDPYRALWLYLAASELKPKEAKARLAEQRIANAGDTWGWVLADLMLGAIGEKDFLDNYATQGLGEDETLAERMCEAYFYLGKLKQLQQQHDAAAVYFRLALTTNVSMYLEHRFAVLEMERSHAKVVGDTPR